MDLGLILSAVFFIIVAVSVIGGYSKGKKYVWQYTLTELLTSVTAVVVAIPVTKALAELITSKLLGKLLFKKEDGALAGFIGQRDAVNAIFAVLIALLLFLFVRLAAKYILKLLSPTVSSLLISLSDIATKDRAAKKAKRIAKEVAALEAALEAKEKALQGSADGADEPSSDAEAVCEEQSPDAQANKGAKADADNAAPREDAKRNGCYALQPQLLSILIGIIGGVLGVVFFFAPLTGALGFANDVITPDADGLDGTYTVDEELYSKIVEITDGSAVRFVNSLGGEIIFNSLSTVESNGKEISLRDESSLLIELIKAISKQ